MRETAQQRSARLVREGRIENVEFLLDHESNGHAIAKRAGFPTTATAMNSLRRWGRYDLARRLGAAAREGDPYDPTSKVRSLETCS